MYAQMHNKQKKFMLPPSALCIVLLVSSLPLAFAVVGCSSNANNRDNAEASAQTTDVRVKFLRPSERAAIARAQSRASTPSRTPSANPGAGNASDVAALFGGPNILGASASTTPRSASPLAPSNAQSQTADDAWAVVLFTLDAQTPGAAETAAIAATEVQNRGGISQARAVLRGDAWVVAAAEFPREQESQARAEYARIRDLTIDGTKPFAAATLLAPAKRGEAGTLPEFDLSTLRARITPGIEYTLQIGIYQVDDGAATPTDAQRKEIRTAAETAVKTLRADGVEAFYWHGPTRSTVTVGLFGERDLQRTVREAGKELVVPQRSEKLAAAQAAFPQNLVNGMAIRVRVQGADTPDKAPIGRAGGFQPSFLIRIPER